MTKTTDARVASGRLAKTPVSHSSTGTVTPARTSIASWVWVPDLSETAVLVGEPSTTKEDPRPFTMFATPRPVRSRFGSCVSSCWMANALAVETLCATQTSRMTNAVGTSASTSTRGAVGTWMLGNPAGSAPTIATPRRACHCKVAARVMLPTTATSGPGIRGETLARPRMVATTTADRTVSARLASGMCPRVLRNFCQVVSPSAPARRASRRAAQQRSEHRRR